MTKESAKQILGQSVSNLNSKKGSLSLNDLEAEVINNTCLFILKNMKKKMSESNSIESMFMNGLSATQDFASISKAFTDGAMELFPEQYTVQEAMAATMGIQQNLAWDGMWDFLRDYFQKNHGIKID